MRYATFLIVLLLSTALAMISCAPRISTGLKGQRDFAFVIPCEWVGQDGICLLGKHKAGVPVSLFNVKRSRLCFAKTTKSSYNNGELWRFYFTKVIPEDQCDSPDLYSVAVLGPGVSTYQVLQLKEITDEQIIKPLDDAVRRTTVLESLRMKAQGLIAGEISEIQSDLPKLFHYPNPKIGTAILAYDESGDENNVSGPRVILVNGVPYPLTGWCSYPYMRAFRFNEEYYLESGSCCCGCGITIKELFKIEPAGLIEVHSDGSLSD